MEFEYKVINVDRISLNKESFQIEMVDKFNKLGADGWELVSTEGIIDKSLLWTVSKTTEVLFFFKRAKR